MKRRQLTFCGERKKKKNFSVKPGRNLKLPGFVKFCEDHNRAKEKIAVWNIVPDNIWQEKTLMRLTRTNSLVTRYSLPLIVALPSEILPVAERFATGSSVYLPGITSTLTQASNLTALLKLSR